MAAKQIIIIGAGLSGLTAAHYLAKTGHRPIIIEADQQVGGRVQTDHQDGLLMDRGFQILLPAYPEARAALDYAALDLRYFERGAEIYRDGKLIPFYDPADGLGGMVKTIIGGPGSFLDLFRLLKFKLSLSGRTIADIYGREDKRTAQYLKDYGFSSSLIATFWKPFFQGIFLENDLHTSSRLFEFIFKMFIEDGAAIPARGMGQIPQQLASSISAQDIHLGKKVVSIDGTSVTTDSGDIITGDAIVIACESSPLLQVKTSTIAWKQVTNVYFSTDKLPTPSKYVMLCANDKRRVNNVAFMSQVSKDYASSGQHLISVSANGDHTNDLEAIRSDLQSMYGAQVAQWSHLKTYLIKKALPDVSVAADYNPKVSDNLYICGDHHLEGSINAAMKSGRLAAEAIIRS